MEFISRWIDNMQQETIDKKLTLVSDLYQGWIGLTDNAQNKEDVIRTLNDALKIVDGMKELHNTQPTYYTQHVDNCGLETIAVYHCKRTNTIKSI